MRDAGSDAATKTRPPLRERSERFGGDGRPQALRRGRPRGGSALRMAASVGTGLVVTIAASAAVAQVRSEHPRIYLTPESVATLRAELPGDPGFARMQLWMDGNVETPGVPAQLAQSASFNFMAGAAFVAVMLPDDEAYAEEARSWLASLAAYEPDLSDGNNINLTRARLYAMALGYDWLHEGMTPGERATVRESIVTFGSSLDAYVASPNYVSGPSRWANVVSLAGAIAVHGEDARLDDTLAAVLTNWREGYNPALERIGDGGGHHMAWMYGPAYSGTEAYLMWKTASSDGETWMPEFLHDVAYFHLYAVNARHRVPTMGDCFGDKLYPAALGQVAVASGIFGNPHAEAFYRELEASYATPQAPLQQPHELWLRLLTRATAPDPVPLETLPLSRFFPGSGFLVSRDDWAREEATTLVFKASPFYSVGHHQRDEGSLVIDYQGPLLVDPGKYDGSGSDDHYWHFYARSVAHNTLLVRWPEEPPFSAQAEAFGLDGGQELKLSQAQDVEGMEGAFALRGIVGHADAGACLWARSDTADTYRSEKLTSYTRDVLEVRRPGGAAHPAVFVVDRATLPVAREAAILWQLADGGLVEGSRISARGAPAADGTPSEARLRIETLRPTSPQLVSFSGEDRWRVGDESHPPVGELLSPYWGRVEVSPPAPELAPTWSTLLRVGDENLDTDPLVALDVGGDDWIGARLGDTLFAIASPATSRLELPAGDALVDGCIAGLTPGSSVDVVVGDQPAVTSIADDGGIVVFDPSPGEGGGSATSSADAAAGPGGGGTGGSGANGATAGSAGPSTVTGATGGGGDGALDDDGGCGCEAPGHRPNAPAGAIVAAAAAVAWGRRRRGSARRSHGPAAALTLSVVALACSSEEEGDSAASSTTNASSAATTTAGTTATTGGTGAGSSTAGGGEGGSGEGGSGEGGGGEGGSGEGGGPVELVFASAWDAATGNGEEAFTDGGRWDGYYCQQAGDTLTVVAGETVGWTRTANVLRLQQLGETACGTLEKSDAVPESTTHWGRFYFRNDETGTVHNHVVTYNPLAPIQVAIWNRDGSVDGVRPFLRTYYDAQGQGTEYPTNLWAPLDRLENGTWYRYEWMMEYVSPTEYRIWPRLHDMEGRLLVDAAGYFQNDYPQSGPDSLDTYYAAGNAFGFTDVALARNFGLGNEGPATSQATGGYWYHADVALSLEGWIGP